MPSLVRGTKRVQIETIWTASSLNIYIIYIISVVRLLNVYNMYNLSLCIIINVVLPFRCDLNTDVAKNDTALNSFRNVVVVLLYYTFSCGRCVPPASPRCHYHPETRSPPPPPVNLLLPYRLFFFFYEIPRTCLQRTIPITQEKDDTQRPTDGVRVPRIVVLKNLWYTNII